MRRPLSDRFGHLLCRFANNLDTPDERPLESGVPQKGLLADSLRRLTRYEASSKMCWRYSRAEGDIFDLAENMWPDVWTQCLHGHQIHASS